MNRLFALLFLMTMCLGVALPALERLEKRGFFAIEKTADADDSEEKGGSEKGSEKDPKAEEKEKESPKNVDVHPDHFVSSLAQTSRKSARSTDEKTVSELFALTPEQPPEA